MNINININNNTEYDIVIIGAGLTGSIQALLLAEAGFNILLLDAVEEEPVKYKNNISLESLKPSLRMSLLTLRSLNILKKIGIYNNLDKRSGLVDKMHIWDAQGPGEVNLDSLLIGEKYLGKLVENDYLQELLSNKTRQNKNIYIIRPCKINSIIKHNNYTELSLYTDHQNLLLFNCHLIIGADGANSWVRQYFNFDCKIDSYGHSALVTNVYANKAENNTAYQQFLPDGPIAFLPWVDRVDRVDGIDSQNKKIFSIVWSQSPKNLEHWLNCEKNIFINQLNNLTSNQFEIVDCDARLGFPLVKRHVGKYYKNGCVLIADAAHTIHPLAGQGLNLGIYDAQCLAEVLIYAHNNKYRLDSDYILKKYDLARRGHNQLIINLMSFFKTIFSNQYTSIKLIRNLGMNLVDNIGFIKKNIIKHAAGYF